MDEVMNYAAQYTPVNAEGDVSDGSVDYYDFNWENTDLSSEADLLGTGVEQSCSCSNSAAANDVQLDYEIVHI